MALAPAVIYGGRAVMATGAPTIIKQQANNFLRWFGYGSLAATPVTIAATSGVDQSSNTKKYIVAAGVAGIAYLALKK